jgi:acetyl-CoA acetyltransferase
VRNERTSTSTTSAKRLPPSRLPACLAGWPNLNPEKVDIHGGSIASRHPLGSSGAHILDHLAHDLARRSSGVCVAAICIRVGQGLATVAERQLDEQRLKETQFYPVARV